MTDQVKAKITTIAKGRKAIFLINILYDLYSLYKHTILFYKHFFRHQKKFQVSLKIPESLIE